MTVPANITKSGPYTANGVQVDFDYDFKIYASTDLEVVQTDLDLVESVVSPSDYTVPAAGLNNDAGGTITMDVAPTNLYLITIRLAPPAEQQTNLRNQGPYDPETVERALDRLALQIQYLYEIATRAVLVDISSGLDPADLIDTLVASTATAVAAAAAAAASATSASKRTSIADADARSLATTDVDKYVYYSGTGGHTWTIPTFASQAIGADEEIDISNAGTGNLILTAAGGVTVNGVVAGSITLPPWTTGTLKKIGAASNVWHWNGYYADGWA